MKTKSTKELLGWVNTCLHLNISSLEELTNGAVFCQIMDTNFPNEKDIRFINYFASNQAASIKNYKILQKYFRRARVVRDVGNINLLVSGNKSELLDLLKYLFEFIRKKESTSSKTSQTSKINAKQRRAMTMHGGSEILPQRILGKLEQEFRVSTKPNSGAQQETYLNIGVWNGEKTDEQIAEKEAANSQLVVPRRYRPESAPATVQKLLINVTKQKNQQQNDIAKSRQDLLFVPPHESDRLSISEPASPREPRTGALPQDYPFSHPVPFGGEVPDGTSDPPLPVPQDLNLDRLKTVEWLTQNEPENTIPISSGIRPPRKLQQQTQNESENFSQNVQCLSKFQHDSETYSNAIQNNQHENYINGNEFGGAERPAEFLQQTESMDPPFPASQAQQVEGDPLQVQILETCQNHQNINIYHENQQFQTEDQQEEQNLHLYHDSQNFQTQGQYEEQNFQAHDQYEDQNFIKQQENQDTQEDQDLNQPKENQNLQAEDKHEGQNFQAEDSNFADEKHFQVQNQNDESEDLNQQDSNLNGKIAELQAENLNLQVQQNWSFLAQDSNFQGQDSLNPMNQDDDIQPDSKPPNSTEVDVQNVENEPNRENQKVNTQPQSEVFFEVDQQSLNNNIEQGEQEPIVSQSMKQFPNLKNIDFQSNQENDSIQNENSPIVQNVQIFDGFSPSNVDYNNQENNSQINIVQPLIQEEKHNFSTEYDDQGEKQDLFSRSCLQFMSETQLTPEPDPADKNEEQKFLQTLDFMDEYTLIEQSKFPCKISPSQSTQSIAEKQKQISTAQLVLEIEADETQKISPKSCDSSFQSTKGKSNYKIAKSDNRNIENSNNLDWDLGDEHWMEDKKQGVEKSSFKNPIYGNNFVSTQQKQQDFYEEECEIQIADKSDEDSPKSYDSDRIQFKEDPEQIHFSDEEQKSPKEEMHKQKQRFKSAKSISRREESRPHRSKSQKEYSKKSSKNQNSSNNNSNSKKEFVKNNETIFDEPDRRDNSHRSLSPETEVIDFDEHVENQNLNMNNPEKQNDSEIQVGSSSTKSSKRRNFNSGDKKSAKTVIKESFVACEAAIQLLSEGLDDFDNYMKGISQGESKGGVNTSDEKYKIMRTIIHNFIMISCQVLVILYMLQTLLKRTIQEDQDAEYVTQFPVHVEKLKKIIHKCRNNSVELQNCEQRSPKFRNSNARPLKAANDSVLIRIELLQKKIQRVFLHVTNLDPEDKILHKSRKRLMSNASIQEFIYLNSDKNVFCVGDTSLRKKEAGKIASMYRKEHQQVSLNTNPLGKKHGDGFYKFKNGDIFKGEFFQDRMEGLGVYTFSAGGQYCGEWRKSIYEGIGAETFARGSKFEGQYMNGLRHGYGTCEYYNGDTYVGQWFGGCRQGVGLQKCEDGSQYYGEYKDGKRQGVGVYTFSNNDRYMGQYDNDLPHGFGVYEFASGYKYQGEWQHGEKQGWCEYFVSSGDGVVALFKGNKRQWMVDPNNNQLSNEDNKRVQLSKKQSAAALKAKEEAVACEKQLRDKSGDFLKRISQIKQKVQETEQKASESARRSMYLYNNLLLTQEILGMGFKE